MTLKQGILLRGCATFLSTDGVAQRCLAAPLVAIGWREQGSADRYLLLTGHPTAPDDRAIQAQLALALATAA